MTDYNGGDLYDIASEQAGYYDTPEFEEEMIEEGRDAEEANK